MKVLVCVDWNQFNETCLAQAWVSWPGVIPPLPVEQGVQLSALMWGLFALAWGYRAVRRFISPRIG